MKRRIAAAITAAIGTIGLSIPTAWATSPSKSHPYYWGSANYQIVGSGTYVEYFRGVVINAIDEPVTAQMWIEYNNQRITPVRTVVVNVCGIWNWKVPEYRNMGRGAYWVNYFFRLPGGPRQYIHWSYNVI